MPKQHHKPCGTCPFTTKFSPNEFPGGSPLGVYVAQHFMPFQVPCHECVDYESDKNWKTGALKVAQCVGFAECRNSAGGDEHIADELPLLRETFDEKHNVFRDIWDFWAHHKQIERYEALIEVRPDVIMAFCLEELMRSGRTHVAGNTARNFMELASRAVKIATPVWEEGMRSEFSRLLQDVEMFNVQEAAKT